MVSMAVVKGPKQIKPTLMQRFFAWGWPIQVWFSMFLLAGIVKVVGISKPTAATFRNWQYVLLFLFAMILTLLVSLLVGIVISGPILGAIYYAREKANGGPFKASDVVYIIAGKHKGKITRVYSQWQHGTVRVELGDKEKETFKDIFGGSSLLRVSEGEHNDC